ncbi:hypothetical protein, partial [Burkholderia cepacia]|uniref:hypothetical protein n=1 Tax=Burkholderia cepacia TaxID=292 RepID=UPI001E3871FC
LLAELARTAQCSQSAVRRNQTFFDFRVHYPSPKRIAQFRDDVRLRNRVGSVSASASIFSADDSKEKI